MLSRVFTTDDTTIYATWQKEEGGIVVLFVPGIGEIRMTLDKADEIADEIKRQSEYGRWNAMEEKHNSNMSPLEQANEENRKLYPRR